MSEVVGNGKQVLWKIEFLPGHVVNKPIHLRRRRDL